MEWKIERPLIAVTMGDPAGIGPEIALKALEDQGVVAASRPLVIGDWGVMKQTAKSCGVQAEIRVVAGPEEGAFRPGTINLLDLSNVDQDSLQMGAVQAMCGRAAFEYIKKAVELASSGRVEAIATGPIHKEALREAEVDFIGHTEILAALTASHDPLTMFQVSTLRVFFLSRHVSLGKACEMVTRERLLSYIQRCSEALLQLGVREGSLAVAGLEPAQRRTRPLWRGGGSPDRARHPGGPASGLPGGRPSTCGLGLSPGPPGPVQCGFVSLPRPGPHRHQDGRLRTDHLCHPGAAFLSDLGQPLRAENLPLTSWLRPFFETPTQMGLLATLRPANRSPCLIVHYQCDRKNGVRLSQIIGHRFIIVPYRITGLRERGLVQGSGQCCDEIDAVVLQIREIVEDYRGLG